MRMGIIKRPVENFNAHFISFHRSVSTSSHNLTSLPEHMQNILVQPGYGYCLTCEDFIYDGWVRRNGRAPEFRQKADATVDKFTEDGDSIVTAESLISMILYK